MIVARWAVLALITLFDLAFLLPRFVIRQLWFLNEWLYELELDAVRWARR